MSRIDELIEELCPDGVEYKELGSVAKCYAGATPKTGVSEYWENGTIPWMSSGEVNKGKVFNTEIKITQKGYDSCSTKLVPANTVVVALAGQGKTRGTVAITQIPLCTNQSLCSIVLEGESINSTYVFHYLRTQYQQLRSISSGDGTRGGLNLQMIRGFCIPVPPLEIQNEIVRILDLFTELEAELKAELKARKTQYTHYQNTLLSFEGKSIQWKMIKELFDFKNGLNKGKEFFGKGTPIINFTDVFKNRSLTAASLKGKVEVTAKEKLLYSAQKNDVFFTRTSETQEEIGMVSALLDDVKDCVFSGFVLRARPKTNLLNPKFCSYYLSSFAARKEIVRTSTFTTRALTSGPRLAKIRIPIPSLSEQEKIVSILDKFDALVNDISIGLPAEIEARRKQYDYYRNKLLTFKPLSDG